MSTVCKLLGEQSLYGKFIVIPFRVLLLGTLKWLPMVSLKGEKKCKFQPQKLPMDISEKNETKDMH